MWRPPGEIFYSTPCHLAASVDVHVKMSDLCQGAPGGEMTTSVPSVCGRSGGHMA